MRPIPPSLLSRCPPLPSVTCAFYKLYTISFEAVQPSDMNRRHSRVLFHVLRLMCNVSWLCWGHHARLWRRIVCMYLQTRTTHYRRSLSNPSFARLMTSLGAVRRREQAAVEKRASLTFPGNRMKGSTTSSQLCLRSSPLLRLSCCCRWSNVGLGLEITEYRINTVF